ncbi:hypothetical protein DL766_004220 [Monosporascus sp. MC13-8B]|uniref:SPX domain-containing protein n=1 Tax=Monosporascus cannonballus TaxID=155416 RepID=A0ABY0HEI9_9PEZI|nr:hypothetical protein DL762_002090 [Monosporascus cannonballus]RYP31841.1 hypothetical protein DL766_004220 [Monosporascus sp. MC13-8B]
MDSQDQLDQHPHAGDLSDKFKDFDLKAVFRETAREAASENCSNFVVEFGPRRARVARDLELCDFESMFRNPTRGDEYPIRWINIWDTYAQKDLVDFLGQQYEFSDRLRSLVKMKPVTKWKEERMKQRRKVAGVQKPAARGKATSTESALERGEKTSSTESEQLPAEPVPEIPLDGDDIQLYFLLKETVNYSSIDHTDRDTVLSFHEEPTIEPAPPEVDAEKWRLDNLKSMKSNMLNVLKQLSHQGYDEYKTNPLTQSSVRKALQALEAKRKSKCRPEQLSQELAEGGASNLFYYLFEDYTAAGPFQAARDTLNELTPIVLNSDHKTSEIIPRLHDLSKELRELRHLFENYRNLIKKIMVTTKPEGATGEYPWNPTGSLSNLSNPIAAMDTPIEEPRVKLTKSALDRFDRLADRLQWLMLNTIQGHLEEIAALSDTYFNLTQQKDSHATAKLNRSATLLAKLSVLFLPISFMTGYFGVEISDLNDYWTAETYWYSFAVIASLSFLCLFFFGRMIMFFSDTLDELRTQIARQFRAGIRRVLGRLSRGKAERDRNADSR